MIVHHIHYHLTDGTYDSDIFTAASKAEFDKAYQATKHVTDYVVSDSIGERNFAHDLDEAMKWSFMLNSRVPSIFLLQSATMLPTGR